MLNFIEELTWRGMLHDMTPGVEEQLKSGNVLGYIGFDPTAPSMTIGNYVQIMLLKLFQLSGHKPIVLMGGATGRIGDPSGKDKERELKSYDELDSNLRFQMEQVKKFLDFDGPNAAIVVNNLDFYKDMNVLSFLRDVGKTLTINYMLSKDSVKNRMDSGLSFTEFSYQLLQSYDFQVLYSQYNCVVQMGGSDQWGNITSGTEFIRRNTGGKAFAITTPLLTKADGTKFGKSEQGNIWLDAGLTSPYRFYQFWINCDDRDLPKFFRYFTLRSKSDVESLENQHRDDPRALKAMLAEELTRRVHSDEEYESVLAVSHLLFNKDADATTLLKLSKAELKTISEEIPSVVISRDMVGQENIADLLTSTGLIPSKSEVRKAIQNNAISVNKQKITTHEWKASSSDLLHNNYILIENGKKNKYILTVE
jgi:tyrosyl-tRNA synthetase